MTLREALLIIEDKLRNHRCAMRIDCAILDGSGMDFNGYLKERGGGHHDLWAGVVAAGPTVEDVLCSLARGAQEEEEVEPDDQD